MELLVSILKSFPSLTNVTNNILDVAGFLETADISTQVMHVSYAKI